MSQNTLTGMTNLMGKIHVSILGLKIFNIAIFNSNVSSVGSLGQTPTWNLVENKGKQVGGIKISLYRIYLYVAYFSGSLTLRY